MNNASTRFEKLLSRYFNQLLAENPSYAAYVGIDSARGKFGPATLAHEKRWHAIRQKALAELESLSPRELTNEQHLDRLAFRSQLLRECEDFEGKRYSLNPDALDHVLNLLLHELQRSEDEPGLVARNLRSLLKQTPPYLTDAVKLIDRPERVWRTIMQQTAAGAPSLFDAVAVFLKKNQPHSSDAALTTAAQKAFAAYRKKVMSRPLAKAGSFAVGAETLQRRVRDQLGLDYSLGEIEALALSEIKRVG